MDTNKLEFINDFIAKANLIDPAIAMDRLSAVGEYFYFLHEENKIHNLTGYKTLDEYISYHFIDTLKLMEFVNFSQFSQITDVGTGAGVPGMLLKILRPDIRGLFD